jgi:hypothetical protein
MKTLLAAFVCTLAIVAAPCASANLPPPDPYPAHFRFPWGVGVAILGVIGVVAAALWLRSKPSAAPEGEARVERDEVRDEAREQRASPAEPARERVHGPLE